MISPNRGHASSATCFGVITVSAVGAPVMFESTEKLHVLHGTIRHFSWIYREGAESINT